MSVFDKMKKISTILFDLDGTLLDTLYDLTASVNHALSHYGFPVRTEPEIKAMLGNGVKALMQSAVPVPLTSYQFDEVFTCFKDYYMAHSMDSTKPYAGVMDLLRVLKQKHYKLAIVSNKMHVVVQSLCRHFFSKYIDVAIGESTSVRRKPFPDAAITALNFLGSKVEEAVYVGDSEVDLEMAYNAMLPCLSVCWGFRDESFLRSRGAKFLVQSPSDIITALEKWNNNLNGRI